MIHALNGMGVFFYPFYVSKNVCNENATEKIILLRKRKGLKIYQYNT